MLLSRLLHRAAGQPDRTAVLGMWRGFLGLGAAGGALTGLPYVHRQAGHCCRTCATRPARSSRWVTDRAATWSAPSKTTGPSGSPRWWWSRSSARAATSSAQTILLLGKGLTSGYAPLAAVVLSDEKFAYTAA
ncbi:hypothetical protein ABNF97_23950 [Plantactinospora sp. B6F1]